MSSRSHIVTFYHNYKLRNKNEKIRKRTVSGEKRWLWHFILWANLSSPLFNLSLWIMIEFVRVWANIAIFYLKDKIKPVYIHSIFSLWLRIQHEIGGIWIRVYTHHWRVSRYVYGRIGYKLARVKKKKRVAVDCNLMLGDKTTWICKVKLKNK